MVDIVLTSNSPGEVASWVRVTAAALRRQAPDARITVALVPCPYATGAELSVVKALPGVDRALGPWETTRWYLGGSQLDFSQRGTVVFLGGEPWHALLLARRLGYPSQGYFPHKSGWQSWFSHTVPSDEVGDLMVDGLAIASQPSRSEPVLALFPGSRLWHVRSTLGPFLHIVENLARRMPAARFVLVQSPFVDDAGLQSAIDHPWSLGVKCARGTVLPERVVTEGGVEIFKLRGSPAETFPHFDLAMTIPGTNTAELACAGKPFVTCLSARAFIGAGGLWGLLERLPLPRLMKTWLRNKKHRKLGLLAIPNLKAGRTIAPEVVVRESTQGLQDVVFELLCDRARREQIGRELQETMGRPGAADRLAARILRHV